MNGNSITLEPRLREYINKKRYYAENDIDPVVPLEEQYTISDYDRKILRSYLKGDTKTFEKRAKKNPDMLDARGQRFPSSDFKYDVRFDRLKKKMEREKDAKIQRSNYGIIKQRYDMYDDERDYASPMGDDRAGLFTRSRRVDFDDSPKKNMRDDFLLDSRYNIENPNMLDPPKRHYMYNDPPKIQYNFIEASSPEKSGSVFKRKAFIMEEGQSLTITPKNNKFLAFQINGEQVFSKKVFVPNPGGTRVAGSFKSAFDSFMQNNANQVLTDIGFYDKINEATRIESDIAVSSINKGNLNGSSLADASAKKIVRRASI